MRFVFSVILLGLIVSISNHVQAEPILFNNIQHSDKKIMNNDLWPKPTFDSVLGEFLPVVSIYSRFLDDDSNRQSIMRCAATSIGNSLIITARHCIEIKGRTLLSMFALPDIANGVSSIELASFREILELGESTRAYHMTSTQPYLSKLPPRDRSSKVTSIGTDIAIIKLKRDISHAVGSIDFLPRDAFEQIKSRSFFGMIGFPSVAQEENKTTYKYFSGFICKILGENKNALYTNCIPNSGISGSPLLVNYSGGLYMVGINSGLWKFYEIGPSDVGATYAGLKPVYDLLYP